MVFVALSTRPAVSSSHFELLWSIGIADNLGADGSCASSHC